MKKLILMIICLTLQACSFNVSMAHTQGTATDIIDDTASNTPDISPTVTLPISATGL